MIPDDSALTHDGLRPDAYGHVLVIACGALAHEILALIRLNGWDHLDLQCLPAILHNTPSRIPGAVADAIAKARPNYTEIFVAYADCGTGGALRKVCDTNGVRMIPGPHCYAFFDGLDRFAARDEATCFYLTDFLARQFDAFVWTPLGLDNNPDLLPLYFGNYEKLVYLAQTDDADLTARAKRAADRLGLGFERRATGYGDLATALQTV